MVWIQRLFVLGLCAFLGYMSLSYRLGGVKPSDFRDGTVAELPSSWQTTHSDSWVTLARQAAANDDYSLAEDYALKALSQELSSGNAAFHLNMFYETQEKIEDAFVAANLADKLWPAHIHARLVLADFWLRQQRYDKIMHEWNVILIHMPSMRDTLYPVLLEAASKPDTLANLLPYIQTPPSWWNSFFGYVSRSSPSIQVVSQLFQARQASSTPISEYENRVFTARLLRDKEWALAYQTWYNGLSEAQKKLYSTVYDGGFEDEKLGGLFGWQPWRQRNVAIRAAATSGQTGKKALLVHITGTKRINFRHIRQRLLLSPGIYSLSMKYRLDRLKTKDDKGLTWRIRCAGEGSKILGESQNFEGRSPWDTLVFDFIIPNETQCRSQILRLEATSHYAHHHTFKGRLWFDDITIARNNVVVEEQLIE